MPARGCGCLGFGVVLDCRRTRQHPQQPGYEQETDEQTEHRAQPRPEHQFPGGFVACANLLSLPDREVHEVPPGDHGKRDPEREDQRHRLEPGLGFAAATGPCSLAGSPGAVPLPCVGHRFIVTDPRELPRHAEAVAELNAIDRADARDLSVEFRGTAGAGQYSARNRAPRPLPTPNIATYGYHYI